MKPWTNPNLGEPWPVKTSAQELEDFRTAPSRLARPALVPVPQTVAEVERFREVELAMSVRHRTLAGFVDPVFLESGVPDLARPRTNIFRSSPGAN